MYRNVSESVGVSGSMPQRDGVYRNVSESVGVCGCATMCRCVSECIEVCRSVLKYVSLSWCKLVYV